MFQVSKIQIKSVSLRLNCKKMIKISKNNLDFLRRARKIYFVAMTLELDEGHTDSPVIYTGVGKARMTRAALKFLKENPALASAGVHDPAERMRLVEEGKLPLIVNLGTAGSGKLGRGDIVLCTNFVNNGDDFIRERLYFPVVPEPASYVCGSSDWCISEKNFSNSEVASMREEFDCLDMEAYALANICDIYGLPFCAVKCISDGADDTVLNFDLELPRFRAMLNEFVESLN